MKILIAGDWKWPQYEAAFAEALKRRGHMVFAFPMLRYFGGRLGRYQKTFPVPGPSLLRLNRDLMRAVEREAPDAVLVWRGTHVFPGTVRRIAARVPWTFSYNNDDPFGPAAHGKVPWHHHALWFWYLRSLRHFRCNLFYRAVNVEEAKAWGSRRGEVLMPYFIPWVDRPLPPGPGEAQRFDNDVVFVGHYEDDHRMACLAALIDAGVKVRLYGDAAWNERLTPELKRHLGEVRALHGDDYTKALSGAKICLAFLSKLNRDTYTRRCFEIPACGSVLLCERTADLARLFVEDRDACFFTGAEDLVEKTKRLLSDPGRRVAIAEAGRARVWAGGHDVVSRTGELESLCAELPHPERA